MSLIVRHMQIPDAPSITSINDLGATMAPVWKKVAGCVGGKQYSLDDIEHEVLRGTYHEPRFHACLVCASLSCPDLRREAFTADLLDQQMDDQMGTWLGNPGKGCDTDDNADAIRISKIFLWYKCDFHKDIKSYVSKYLDPDDADCAKACKHVRYFEYDWSLNRKEATLPPLGTERRAMSLVCTC